MINSTLAIRFPFVVLFVLISAGIRASNYYLSSVDGSDDNNGMSKDTPWKSLRNLQALSLNPGDTVYFARGSAWKSSAWECVLLIDDNGTPDTPIVFTAYGSGEKPSFSNGGQKWNKGIKVSAKHNIIENIVVKDTGYSGIELSEGADKNIIRNCEIYNCGVGIWVYGKNNLLTKNYIHDLKMIVDDRKPDNDFGCVAFWIYGPDNEISYNRAINNVGHSYDYINDGGFVEFYSTCHNTFVHHNWVETGNGICEASLGEGKNILFTYNVFIENKGMFAFHTDNFELLNFRFENNTCITRNGTHWNNMFNFWPNEITHEMVIVRNNIFVLGGSKEEQVSHSSTFTHEYNIYFLVDGATLGDFVPGNGEILADPLFVDEKNKNFSLKKNSPAVDAGIDLKHSSDFINNPVPKGKAPDMGAFEFNK